MPELPAEPAQPQNRKTAATDAPESFIWMLEAMLERVMPRLLPPPAPPPPGPANEPYLIDRKEIQGLGFTGDWLRKQVKAGKLHRFGRGKYSRFEFYRLIGKIT